MILFGQSLFTPVVYHPYNTALQQHLSSSPFAICLFSFQSKMRLRAASYRCIYLDFSISAKKVLCPRESTLNDEVRCLRSLQRQYRLVPHKDNLELIRAQALAGTSQSEFPELRISHQTFPMSPFPKLQLWIFSSAYWIILDKVYILFYF